MRPWQWYKNLLIFLAPIFMGQLFDFSLFISVLIGFVSLCLVSSSNYIINDLIDKKKDIIHPEKKNRPIASGLVKSYEAVIFAIILLFFSLLIGYYVSFGFLIIVIILFSLTTAYSLFLKNEVFVDLLIIAINFILRALSGVYVFPIRIEISPWLILCTFFLSLFLSTGKRYSEINLLKEDLDKYRVTLKHYTKKITDSLMIIATVSLIISYSLYSFLSQYQWLLITIPIAMYTILRYLHLIYSGSNIPRNPEKVIKDSRMVISVVIWFVMILFLIYLF